MKKICFSLAFVGLFFIAQAQKNATITETSENIADANGSALRVEIFQTDSKTILKEWKSKMKKYDGDVKIKKGELIASNVKISLISEHEIKVYAKVKDYTKSSKEVFFIFLNGNQSISSTSDISGFTAAKEIVSSFATELSKNSTKAFFDNQDKALNKLQKELKDLVKEKEKAEKEIENCKESIKDNEYKIVDNKEKQSDLIKKIDSQKKIVKDAKNNKEVFE